MSPTEGGSPDSMCVTNSPDFIQRVHGSEPERGLVWGSPKGESRFHRDKGKGRTTQEWELEEPLRLRDSQALPEPDE